MMGTALWRLLPEPGENQLIGRARAAGADASNHAFTSVF